MTFVPLLAAMLDNPTVWIVLAFVAVFLLAVMVWASRYTKVGPNQVLIVSGRRMRTVSADGRGAMVGFRIVKGGGSFIWPVVERVDLLSLDFFFIDL